jgi:hypothetical protein
MATTKTKATSSSNGSAPAKPVAMAKEAGESAAGAAKRVRTPLLAAGATAAGLAGGLALGARMGAGRKRVLGLPIGRKSGLTKAAEALGQLARELGSASAQAATATDDVHQIKEELGRANRQSPVEVLLDGLTHRRGAHKREA